jgi:dienelactone hydrolase
MIGRTLSQFKITAKLGEGGMGEVYRATDTRLGREVAIKVLPAGFGDDEERVGRLEQEARLLAALNHTNVATLFGLEEAEGTLLLVMEWVDGQDLAERIEQGPLSLEDCLRFAEGVAAALEAAHQHNIIHRDLKPGNVMVTTEGEVKVLDFGIATAAGPTGTADAVTDDSPTVLALTTAGELIGTVAYMSPEQARGEPATAASDIWSVGVLLYEMLTGRRPFAGNNMLGLLSAIRDQEPEAIVKLRPDVPRQLAEIVETALAKKPSGRQSSMSELRRRLEELRTGDAGGLLQQLRKPWILAAGAAIVVLGGWLLIAQSRQRSEARWARQTAIPEIARIADALLLDGPSDDAWRAVALAERAEAAIPGDPTLAELWGRIADERTEIEGGLGEVRLSARPYAASDPDWTPIPLSPDGTVRLPLGYSRIRLEREGAPTMERLMRGDRFETWALELYGKPPPPAGMVLVRGREADEYVSLTGLGEPRLGCEDFALARFEVTNAEYGEFVAGGGYAAADYWLEPVVIDGRELTWEETRELFVDATGQPGPATWEVGDYPEGADELPVGGVSWYEAAAYAAFAQKDLPTLYHWDRAAAVRTSLAVIPRSNLESDGPIAVGSSDAMNRAGTFDMGGNVREWVWNAESDGSRRFILGGGWTDPEYAFTDAYAQSALDRSPINGIRLMQYLGEEPRRAELQAPLARPHRDFFAETPVDDATFDLFLRQYDYDPGQLDAEIEESGEEDDWTWERVAFNAAYGGERMAAYVALPKNSEPPYQTVIYFPGSGALYSDDPFARLPRWEIFAKSGRAFVLPIYKSTYGRQDGVKSDYPDDTVEYREHVIMWVKDFSRTIDYLETRDDIDNERLAYFGASWGGAMGGIVPAVERRVKAVVLLVAGLTFQDALPEIDVINYLERITQPVLMINGQYDFFFPVETSQRPMYELLGTPEEHKKWLVYPGTHSAPRQEYVKETLAWLDKYLGPLR